jgi:hypothetical protein
MSMSNRGRLLSIFILCLLLILPFIYIQSNAQGNEYLYFSETNHAVRGEFLAKFNSVEDPVALYGFPITEALIAPEVSPFSGQMVQYFQRAIFEYHSENAPGHRVQLVPIGSLVAEKTRFTPYQSLPANHPACETFSETGYQVCYDFLIYFNEQDGVNTFGNPITDMVLEEERIVQYFEYARFEWRPEFPTGRRVRLSNLGSLFLNKYEKSSLFIRVKPTVDEALSVESLNLRAFPLHAVMADNGEQTIFTIVQDQFYQGVAGAQITLTIKMPDGQNYIMAGTTNENGILALTFTQGSQSIGRVEISVEASYLDRLKKYTLTSYRIW